MAPPDFALRRMLDELDQLGPAEREEVLASLDPDARRHLDVLRDRAGSVVGPVDVLQSAISEWIVALMEADSVLTPLARATLVDAVAAGTTGAKPGAAARPGFASSTMRRDHA